MKISKDFVFYPVYNMSTIVKDILLSHQKMVRYILNL